MGDGLQAYILRQLREWLDVDATGLGRNIIPTFRAADVHQPLRLGRLEQARLELTADARATMIPGVEGGTLWQVPLTLGARLR